MLSKEGESNGIDVVDGTRYETLLFAVDRVQPITGEMEAAAAAAFLAVFVVGMATGSAVTTVDHGEYSPSLPSPCRSK